MGSLEIKMVTTCRFRYKSELVLFNRGIIRRGILSGEYRSAHTWRILSPISIRMEIKVFTAEILMAIGRFTDDHVKGDSSPRRDPISEGIYNSKYNRISTITPHFASLFLNFKRGLKKGFDWNINSGIVNRMTIRWKFLADIHYLPLSSSSFEYGNCARSVWNSLFLIISRYPDEGRWEKNSKGEEGWRRKGKWRERGGGDSR